MPKPKRVPQKPKRESATTEQQAEPEWTRIETFVVKGRAYDLYYKGTPTK